jgi:large subunit ribosomal protein L28
MRSIKRERMAKACAVTGKTSKVAGGYSNRTRATQFNPTGKNRRKANIQKRKVYVPELKKVVIVNLSTKGLKTLHKKGAYRTLKEAGVIL